MPWSNALARQAPNLFWRSIAALTFTLAASHAAGDVIFVTCQNGNVLNVIDIETGDTQAWPLPGQPAGVAVSQAGDVYTVSPDSKQVRRWEAATGTLAVTRDFDGGPTGIAHDPQRRRLFISDWYNARIWVLDDQTLETLQELPVGAAPAGLALSDDGRFFASADRDVHEISVFDAETLTLVGRHPAGERPYGLRFDPQGRIFVGNVGTDDVTVLDPINGPIATIPVGDRPYGVAFAKGRAFVTNQYENTVSVIDLANLEHVTKIDVGEYPEGIDNSADGTKIIVANWFDNSISIIDAETLDVVKELDTDDGPRAFGEFLLGGEEK